MTIVTRLVKFWIGGGREICMCADCASFFLCIKN